jgi:hypothetical protein
LAGLSLSYAGAPLKPEKGGEDAYGIAQGKQVVEITAFPFETTAKTKESFDNTKPIRRRMIWKEKDQYQLFLVCC